MYYFTHFYVIFNRKRRHTFFLHYDNSKEHLHTCHSVPVYMEGVSSTVQYKCPQPIWRCRLSTIMFFTKIGHFAHCGVSGAVGNMQEITIHSLTVRYITIPRKLCSKYVEILILLIRNMYERLQILSCYTESSACVCVHT